jgi:hypothetical protein
MVGLRAEAERIIREEVGDAAFGPFIRNAEWLREQVH